ncbi:G/U mismatch-specific DNA glycosylase [Spirosoma endbachense]|uniref:G/U mismatch-specific DNA glycosylase n=1 Tax=Spirosoma endbachense TaxID=2666025 RepID=A0A6P1VPZ3_9BACT|nr:G/U mismatch-specific DNA glycosylase [Spirosoma endbachense]QHV95331.1 G/U mismatch-specific DNA glycosylase [Spirosoma endbachense]
MVNSLKDILDANLRIVFCGINPGLKSALDGHHFSGRSNRFWRVLYLAGFTPHEINAREDRKILDYGYGLTTAVARPTSRADELAKEEFDAAIGEFRQKMKTYKPRQIAFLGKPAYQAFSGKKKLTWGHQDEDFEGAVVWVLPNPSGLNRGFSLEALVASYKELRLASS